VQRLADFKSICSPHIRSETWWISDVADFFIRKILIYYFLFSSSKFEGKFKSINLTSYRALGCVKYDAGLVGGYEDITKISSGFERYKKGDISKEVDNTL
jgi:hypothetical protein